MMGFLSFYQFIFQKPAERNLKSGNIFTFNKLSKLNIKLLGVTYLTSWTPEEQADITKEITYNMWKTHIARVMKNNFY